jgi:hypothetical protein
MNSNRISLNLESCFLWIRFKLGGSAQPSPHTGGCLMASRFKSYTLYFGSSCESFDALLKCSVVLIVTSLSTKRILCTDIVRDTTQERTLS